MQKTYGHALDAPNPGGYYAGIWCRDSSYILRDWVLSGRIEAALNQIAIIWSHQIGDKAGGSYDKEDTIICGRGSPEMDFKPLVVDDFFKRKFQGALPTSFYHERGLCEVFGKNPDIDSTALMVSATSWILSRLVLSLKEPNLKIFDDYYSSSISKNPTPRIPILPIHTAKIREIINIVTPKMHTAIDYLASRDIDKDGLLEQNHNEDWMDSIM